MRKVINQKLYDTNTAEIIYKKIYELPPKWKVLIASFFSGYNTMFYVGKAALTPMDGYTLIKRISKKELYKTEKDNYFLLTSYVKNKEEQITPMSIEDTKNFLLGESEDAYISEFGKLEEA
ncbi:hypothetical protein [Sporomusa sphaeroides]|uniref:Uncharacterized protein n=1 Tax=Sporomusa sphaeroides DSM 2875 TaxID=1337886 RepID=A0A1U7M9W5_9FIRM|nr:hypothetical protein [Sporomusa sphaeroides]OLS54339.1 hypothetical protein SPSPH_45850 [Sporomusa sphaeroides DSM 2875]CVK21568.1 hypothetical protein SSPH_04260 [Sporomusa sphaeroides DSM 2875]